MELACCRRIVQLCRDCLLIVYQFAAEAKNAASSSHLAIETDLGRVNRYAAYKLNSNAAASLDGQGMGHGIARVNIDGERVNSLNAGGDLPLEEKRSGSSAGNLNRDVDSTTGAQGVNHVNVTWGQALSYSSPRAGKDVHGVNTSPAVTAIDNYSSITPIPSISQGKSVPNLNPVHANIASNQSQIDKYGRANPLSPRERQMQIGERLNTYVATITHTPHSHKDKRFRVVMTVHNSKCKK